MKTSLERRLRKLEEAHAFATDFLLIIRRFVTPGVPKGVANYAEVMGQRFKREPSETEAEFTQRIHVYAEANRPPGQYAVEALMQEYELDL